MPRPTLRATSLRALRPRCATLLHRRASSSSATLAGLRLLRSAALRYQPSRPPPSASPPRWRSGQPAHQPDTCLVIQPIRRGHSPLHQIRVAGPQPQGFASPSSRRERKISTILLRRQVVFSFRSGRQPLQQCPRPPAPLRLQWFTSPLRHFAMRAFTHYSGCGTWVCTLSHGLGIFVGQGSSRRAAARAAGRLWFRQQCAWHRVLHQW